MTGPTTDPPPRTGIRARGRRRAAGLLLGAALLVGCAAAPDTTAGERSPAPSGTGPPAAAPDTAATDQPPPPYQVVHEERTIVDASRPTPPGAQTPATPDRTLVTTLHVPVVDGPVPLIVFAHGLEGHPRKFSQLLDSWAAAGYAVAAPAFPLTNDDVPGATANWADLADQPGDLTAVLDAVLAANDDPSDPLAGRIDPTRVGAAGLSLGGASTYAWTFNTCCADRRVRAAMVLSGALLPVGGDYELDGRAPLLIVHGTADTSLPYDLAVDAFEQAAGPTWFVTLTGGLHAPPFENTPSPQDGLVEAITTDWWDAELGDDPAALDRFAATVTADPTASLRSVP